MRRPEPQSWLTPQAGLSIGMPAAIEAWRAGFWPCAAVRICPMMTSDTPRRLDAGPLERGLDGDGAEIVGRHGGESTVETADRGAGGADDDDIVGHGHLLGLRNGMAGGRMADLLSRPSC